MRLLEVERTREDWIYFFGHVHSLGIRALHSSHEYESFGLVSSLLKEMEGDGNGTAFRHIVKLAEPSFDDCGFDAQRLEEKVRSYCSALSTPLVHDVQWMWRQGLNEDMQRVSHFRDQIDSIGNAARGLKQAGLIERFFCFPYSVAFGREAMEHPAIDGLVVYRNRLETVYDELIDRCRALSKPCQIIRPLAAGSALGKGKPSPADALRFALDKPAIESAILSSNSVAHLQELVSVVGTEQ